MAILHGAEPFLLPGGEKGVLLLHGFTGSPAEMRLLGEALHQEGYTVLAPRLPGHGTTVEEMAETRWPLWYGGAEDGYWLLRSVCSEVAVVGLSMGGLLALALSAQLPVWKTVSLSAPIDLYDKRAHYVDMFRLFRTYAPKKRRRFADVDDCYTVAYESTPLACVKSLLQLIRHVQRLLPQVQAPLLVMQGRREHTVRPRSALHIYEQSGSLQKELVWLEKSGHLVTLDIERELVFAQVKAFLTAP